MWESAWAIVILGNEKGKKLAGVAHDVGRNFFRLLTDDGDILVPMACCWDIRCS